jgi:uncharacterized membrane protein YhaH (DUF805 family)
MNGKFWAINLIAFLIIIAYTVMYFMTTGEARIPFWQASPFQVVFMGAFFYLVTEGKLVQKVLLAKRLKDEGTHREFGIVNKSSERFDKMVLDKIKKE